VADHFTSPLLGCFTAIVDAATGFLAAPPGRTKLICRSIQMLPVMPVRLHQQCTMSGVSAVPSLAENPAQQAEGA